VAEGEADKKTLAHFVFAIGHVLEGLLFIVDLLVLGHVCFVGEIVKVTCIRLRVELRNKRCLGLPQRVPVNFGKILMVLDILNVGETLGLGVNAPARRLARRSGIWNACVYLRGDETPRSVAEEIIGILPDWSLEHLLPVLQISPRLVGRVSSERGKSGQGLKQHAS
jgi:hypothetical protein